MQRNVAPASARRRSSGESPSSPEKAVAASGPFSSAIAASQVPSRSRLLGTLGAEASTSRYRLASNVLISESEVPASSDPDASAGPSDRIANATDANVPAGIVAPSPGEDATTDTENLAPPASGTPRRRAGLPCLSPVAGSGGRALP